jgi:hypothetical protein
MQTVTDHRDPPPGQKAQSLVRGQARPAADDKSTKRSPFTAHRLATSCPNDEAIVATRMRSLSLLRHVLGAAKLVAVAPGCD